MEDSQKMIATYIEQVLRLIQTREDHMIEPGELDRLAREVGLSDADLDWIDQQFYAFLERGKGFASYQNWEKAIPELEQALHLKPLHLEALNALAGAYRGRWLKSRDEEDKKRASELAERCLRYDPSNRQALRIINFIDKNTSARKARRSKFSYLPVIFVFFGFLALIFGVYTWWQTKPQTVIVPKTSPIETRVIVTEDLGPSDGKKVNLGLSPEMEKDAYFIDTKTVWVEEQEEGNTLWIRAILSNPVYAIDKLRLGLSLQNSEGDELASLKRTLWNEDKPELWPGDRLALHFSYPLPVKDFPETGMYAQLRVEEQGLHPLDTQDLVQQSFYLADPLGNLIQIDQRGQQIESKASYFEQELAWAIRNQGKQAIPFLSLVMEWIDQDGKVLYRKDKRIEFPEGLALEPGQSEVMQFQERIPFKLDRFALYQIRAEAEE